MKPDVVLLASGVVSPPSAISGSGGNNVFSLNDAMGLMNGQVKRGFLWRLAALFLKYFYRPSVLRWLLRFNFPFKKRGIIIGGAFVPNKSLFESLKGKVSELYQVGDCVQARTIHDAIYEGATVSLKI